MKHPRYKLRSNRLYTIYKAMALDLLFFATYYSVFFKDEKGLSNSTITAISLVSSIVFIVLQPLVLKLLNKIGNTKSMRIGNLMLLLALTMMAFCNGILLYIGYALYSLSSLFKVVEPIILRNNLRIEDKEIDFSHIEGNTYFIYSVMTAIIMLFTGFMYQYNHYSIVYACYITTIITVILSFLIKDEQEYTLNEEETTINQQEIKETKDSKNEKVKVFSKIAVLIFLSGFLYSGVIGNTLSGFQLLLKDEKILDIKITLFIFLGRISRMIASACYGKIYKKFKNKIAIILPIFLFLNLLIIFLTGIFVENQTTRLVIYVIVLVITYTFRDPYILYIQDTIFNYVDKENQRNAVSINSLFYKIGSIITNFLTMVVLGLCDEKQYIAFGSMAVVIAISLIFTTMLYKETKLIDNNKQKTN